VPYTDIKNIVVNRIANTLIFNFLPKSCVKDLRKNDFDTLFFVLEGGRLTEVINLNLLLLSSEREYNSFTSDIDDSIDKQESG